MIDADWRFLVAAKLLSVAHNPDNGSPWFRVTTFESLAYWILAWPKTLCEIFIDDDRLLGFFHIAFVKESALAQGNSHRGKVPGTYKTFVRHDEVSRVPRHIPFNGYPVSYTHLTLPT